MFSLFPAKLGVTWLPIPPPAVHAAARDPFPKLKSNNVHVGNQVLVFKGCTASHTELRRMQRRVLKENPGRGMPCKSCGSVNQKKFSAEMGIHFAELKNID
jgi:hypothetical protein